MAASGIAGCMLEGLFAVVAGWVEDCEFHCEGVRGGG